MASSSRTGTAASGHAPKSPESYASLDRRDEAARILQSYERLSWWSFARCESLVQTRLHFENIVAGFTDEDEASLVDWKTDNTRRPKPGEEPRRSSKGRDRASLGAGVDNTVAGPSAQKGDKSDTGLSVHSSTSKKRKSGGGG